MARPTKYDESIIERLFRVFSYPNRFLSEKKMCDLLEANILDFSTRFLHDDVQSWTREYRIGIGDFLRQGIVRPRIDFLIETKYGKRIGIECKNTNRLAGTIQGISQLLFYAHVESIDRLILVTSTFNPEIYAFIQKYNFPIEVILFNKEDIAYGT